MKIANLQILVLGGNGFIGTHLVEALCKQGYSVRVFDRPNSVPLGGKHLYDVQRIEGDFTKESDIAKAVHGCDICIHLISSVIPKTSNLDPVFDIETNLTGSVRLFNQAVKAGVKKIIFLSSGGTVYGKPIKLPIDETHPTNPICAYGITKLATEHYLSLYQQLHGLDYTVLRLSNPFGEKQRIYSAQGVVAVFLGKALRKETIEIWGDGSVVRDYIHISDVVNAVLKSITYSGSERLFNIGARRGISINELLDSIELVTGNEVARKYFHARSFDVPANVLSIDRAIQILDWQPKISFIEGLTRTMNWIKEQEKTINSELSNRP